MKKNFCVICGKYKKLKALKYHTFLKKHYFFLLFAVNVRMKMKKYLKKNNQLRYYKFLAFIITLKIIIINLNYN